MSEILLTLISVQLFILMACAFKIMQFFSKFNPEGILRRAVSHGITEATSKASLKRIETNTMPFIIKMVVVKVASGLLIRYIGKKIR